MSEQKPIRGSVEILSNGISTGMVVNVRSVDMVPVVVEAGQSLTDIAPLETLPEGVEADAAWTAKTADGFDALVLFREDRDLTLQEIAAAIEASKDM